MRKGATAHYKNITREFIKKLNMKMDFREKDGIPDIMPAYGHDIANYAARYGATNSQIQSVIKLDGRLDFEKLSRAVRLSVDAEPVLGCRFVRDVPPYWKRLDNIDHVNFCSMEEAESPEEAAVRFLKSPLDMDRGPMLMVRLIRSGQGDMLAIKLNHTCTDGAGAKEYLPLLAHIYSCIDENGYYEPMPHARSRKDHEKIFRALGIRFPLLDNSLVEAPHTVWPFPWERSLPKFSWKPEWKTDETCFALHRLPYGQLDLLHKYGKERGATINDLILTAFYRAMFKLAQPPYGIPMDIALSVDLRRYLPDKKAEAIRNLSGGIVLRIARLLGEPFEGTLSRVAAAMKYKKSMNPGYQSATGSDRAEMINFRQTLAYFKWVSTLAKIISPLCFYCSPGLSNMGYISESLIKFGKATATDICMIPPAIRAPGILLVACSYDGVLTFTMGYYKGAVKRKHVEKLLAMVAEELGKCCRPET